MTPKTLKLRQKNWNIIFASIIATAIGFSYFLEFPIGLKPCYLCYLQRYMYFALLLPALILVFGAKITDFYKRIFKGLIAILIFAQISVSAYHSLIELKIVAPSQACTVKLETQESEKISIGGLEVIDILKKPSANESKGGGSCAKREPLILGLTLTNLNLLFSLLLLAAQFSFIFYCCKGRPV